MKKTMKLLGVIAFVVIIGFSMTACDDPKLQATQLTANIWSADGNLPSNSSVKWYKLNVVDGFTYRVFIKDYWSDSVGVHETGWASINHAAEYENGDIAYATTGSGMGATGVAFTANRTGEVYIKVTPITNLRGKFRIVYTTSTTRPIGESTY